MIKVVTFLGQDAIDISVASNKQPEAYDDATRTWKTVLMWTAAKVASRSPDQLRVRGPAKTIAEAVLGKALSNGVALADQVRAAHGAMAEPGKTQAVRAVALLLNAIEG